MIGVARRAPPPMPRAASICIVGSARDCGRTIAGDVARLKAATASFARRSIFIVESDSSDDTIAGLRALASKDDTFAYETCGILAERMPLRTERIAYCRNRAVDHVRALDDVPDFVLVADLDGINNAITEASLLSCWGMPVEWDACTSNRKGRYYDIFALRCAGWVDDDCIARTRRLASRLSPALARQICVESRMIVIPPDHPPIPVESAFAGIGLYRGDAFLHGGYDGLDADGAETCEHVSFHRRIDAAGGALYINPRMISGGVSEFPGKNVLRAIAAAIRR